MLIEDRRRILLEAIRSRGSLSVADAEKTLDVSRMTIHRDLDALEAQGLVRKVHGGVMAVEQRGTDLFDSRAQPFEQRLAEQRDQKREIARKVASLVEGASSLLLDASTSVYFLSEHLGSVARGATAREQFVVTMSLPLFTELIRKNTHLRVALTGGEPHVRTGSLVGPLAIASLGELRFDYTVMSCIGVMENEGTAFVASAEESQIKRAFLEHARKKILAIDTSKLGHSGVHPLGPIAEFDYVVTEKAVYTADEFRQAAKKGTLARKR